MARLTAAAALLALACKKNPDPRYIDISDFNSGNQLTDTLERIVPVGTRVPVAWETMQANGFACGQRAATIVDLKTDKLGTGKPYLECYASNRIDFGLHHRDWTVHFDFDTAGVSGISSGYTIQP
jgi:hypothetical protein